MKSKMILGILLPLVFLSEPLLAFVHISGAKPHLPVSPEQPNITFQWNGDAPSLSHKDEVFEGIYANASDSELMEALLQEAANTWNRVESAYLNFEIVANPGVVKDEEDEIYAIVVESQDSISVAAAALPVFAARGESPSGYKKSGRIIYDCDISVSSSGVDAKELLRTLVHEMGHCVGLGHPHSNYLSIMSYSNMSDSAELGLDDKAGISFLYPEPGQSQKVKYLTSCGTVAGGTQEGFWIILLPLAFGVCRRKKASQHS
jgi:hypothetical protein